MGYVAYQGWIDSQGGPRQWNPEEGNGQAAIPSSEANRNTKTMGNKAINPENSEVKKETMGHDGDEVLSKPKAQTEI